MKPWFVVGLSCFAFFSTMSTATATEVGASPAALALGRAGSQRWRAEQEFVLRNVSYRRLILSLDVSVAREGAAALRFDLRPQRFSLGPGRSIRIHVRVGVTGKLVGTAPAEGVVIVTPAAGREIRVPWTIVFGQRPPAGLACPRCWRRRAAGTAKASLRTTTGSRRQACWLQ